LVLSLRDYERNRAHVTQFEFEDVIASVDAVDLVRPRVRSGAELAQLAHRVRNQGRRLVGSMAQFAFVEDRPIERDYELFFAVFHFPRDLTHLPALKGWRRRCRKAVAFVIEMWTAQLPAAAQYLHLLNDFDQVFLFNAASMGSVARLVRAPLAFMPTAVDAFRFSPFPNPAPRAIDFMSYGRRSPAVHRQLLEWARDSDLYYHYDTVGDAGIPDYWLHRTALAASLRRSRYVLTYKVNANRSARTAGEEALAARYFEGAAAGAVLLGSRTDAPEFDACFGWEDAVIELPYAPTDLRGLVRGLERDPDRLVRARTANAVHSLRRHDWVHRWAQVLDAVGLPHTPAMRARAARLAALADHAEAHPERSAEAQAEARRAAARTSGHGLRERLATPRAAAEPDHPQAGHPPALVGAADAASRIQETSPLVGTKMCPNCSEYSPAAARVCRYCGESLPA
jgi:hypothetical protein